MTTKPRVRDVMHTQLVTVDEPTTIAETASVMAQRRIGSVIVLDGTEMVGIFTERDIVRALSQNFDAAGHQLTDWMTRNPVTVPPDADLDQARELMVTRNFRHLPVMEGGRLLGIISMRDVLAAEQDEGPET
jgi:CBS domain-containing protein